MKITAVTIFATALFTVVTAQGVKERDCHFVCATSYKPVCGSDGNTYTNKCVFERAKCQNNALSIVSNGECGMEAHKCGVFECTAEYNPVCGSDHKTYSNQCAFDNAKCRDPSLTIISNGECALEMTKCDAMCSDEYRPVCGSDHLTYSNKCYFDNAKCLNPSLSIVADSECAGN
ncbi:TPA: hypothetical protein N0F65_001326 [Lagenidium giganteum]|uniref:Kazal-like domain-containing protein n=1 Tax=Lagenidium giganteum TaxID=4803 RepID=A0AAV2YXL8_9STRA|nr:TPA: hypothetical protein N0F65_001326 [Lagenidium giganteum]